MTPDSSAQARSEKLIQIIRHEIVRSGGAIPFSQFMDLALYAPTFGYYSAETSKFGEKGDFITASELSPLFAQSIAQQCQQILSELNNGDMLEMGAGSGRFACDILLELEKMNALPEHYFIFEVSPALREQQLQLINQNCPHLLPRITWLNALPKSFTGVIFANEVMDALPTNCFQITENGAEERCVTWENDAFAWSLQAPSIALLDQLKIIFAQQTLPVGYRSEVNLTLPYWIQSLAESLHQGVILLIDYGYGRPEYYHPDRQTGTLMCFYQHRRDDNPLVMVGLQDITAHVDFTTVIECAVEAGLSLAGFTTQAGFLLACGLLDIAAKHAHQSEKEKFLQTQAIKRLTLPSEMGEVIKVMGLSKQFDRALMGFSLQDRRMSL